MLSKYLCLIIYLHFVVSHLLPVLCDFCCEAFSASEQAAALIHPGSNCCGLQVCCQPITAQDLISHLSGKI